MGTWGKHVCALPFIPFRPRDTVLSGSCRSLLVMKVVVMAMMIFISENVTKTNELY